MVAAFLFVATITAGIEWAMGCLLLNLALYGTLSIGAGDSFTAALTLGLLAGWPLEDVHRRAGEIAAYVCSQSGATPELPAHLRAPFLALHSPTSPIAS